MAGAIPFLTTAATIGSGISSHLQNRSAKKDAKASAASQKDATKAQFDKQTSQLNDEQRQSGSRRRIADARSSGGSPTLFSRSGFGGARTSLGT